MAQAPQTLISARTAAVVNPNEAKYQVTSNRVPCSLIADGLAGAEEVDIFFSVDNGTTWVTLTVDGSVVVLTATDTAKTFYGPRMIGVLKDATAAACGVYMSVADRQ